jgi:hypothetical protein
MKFSFSFKCKTSTHWLFLIWKFKVPYLEVLVVTRTTGLDHNNHFRLTNGVGAPVAKTLQNSVQHNLCNRTRQVVTIVLLLQSLHSDTIHIRTSESLCEDLQSPSIVQWSCKRIAKWYQLWGPWLLYNHFNTFHSFARSLQCFEMKCGHGLLKVGVVKP